MKNFKRELMMDLIKSDIRYELVMSKIKTGTNEASLSGLKLIEIVRRHSDVDVNFAETLIEDLINDKPERTITGDYTLMMATFRLALTKYNREIPVA